MRKMKKCSSLAHPRLTVWLRPCKIFLNYKKKSKLNLVTQWLKDDSIYANWQSKILSVGE